LASPALRLGILGCDTSHVVEFTRRLHHRDMPAEQWVDGARVVAAWPGESAIAPERLPGYVRALAELGVAIVDRPEDLAAHRVDAVLVEAQQGSLHAALALPWLQAGVPVFVDKPFACSVVDAAAMVEAAARGRAVLLSASALRFCREVAAARAGQGRLLGAQTYTPATLHSGNPGLFHYGVHGVEMLYALMGGPGCRRLSCISTDGADDVVGVWADGRLGGVRGLRAGARGFGFVAYGEAGIRAAQVDTAWIYRDLLQVVVRVLAGQPSPVPPEELVEVVAFQEYALRSAAADGQPVALPVV
jgi:virulence factor